ncbi:PD40 domain-containing protein [candidate division KSB1 bacterium]|nr:PD40 domain-containing protein [candidate division KSB1 bacterium]
MHSITIKKSDGPLRAISCFALALLVVVMTGCVGRSSDTPNARDCYAIDRLPAIEPDYTATTLPPNIAPTNFGIQEPGRAYHVHIAAASGQEISIDSRSPVIKIPMRAWRNLLTLNQGQSLRITVFVRDDQNKWGRFTSIENSIAEQDITSHLVYRIIPPLYQYYDKMHLYQRDLRSYAERAIAFNKSMGYNCINCHSFHDYNPDRMLFHMRAGAVGTSMILLYDGAVRKVDTKTSFNRATSYRSWHPGGEVVAFAFNDVKQIFHAVGENRDVFDTVSDLLVYNVTTNTISTSPKISTDERMETYPEWSPDGRYLYFCSAPGLDFYDKSQHPYKQMKYDLMRISYDPASDSWGEIEPVLKASEMGMSVAHAKFSPDGNSILLCLSEYSYFPLYRPESDLYLLDVRTSSLTKADPLNSSAAESYHAWSEDGRWIVFSSKRRDGLCTDLYFSYFNGNGQFSKPFILPQKDPELHRKLFRVYNIPEFIRGPVKVRPQHIIRAAWSKRIQKAQLDAQVRKKTSQIEVPMYQPYP